ncbi:unnamed protein product [Camellia sinensis]
MDTQPSKAPEVVTIDVHAAKLLITSGHRFLDVRTEEEFKKGHVDVENALNIPYMFNNPEGRVKNPEFMEQVLSVCKPDDHLVVGCQSGVRSVYATTDLLKAVRFQECVQYGRRLSCMGGEWLCSDRTLRIEESGGERLCSDRPLRRGESGGEWLFSDQTLRRENG